MSELARAVRHSIEQDLIYDFQSDELYSIGEAWCYDALPDGNIWPHLCFVRRDERVPIPTRKAKHGT